MTARRILVALAVLGFGGASFFAGMGVERSNPLTIPVIGAEPDPSIVHQDGTPTCDTRPGGYPNEDGCPIAQGKGFRMGFHTVRDGWSVKAGPRGPITTMTVANENPGAIAGFWHTVHLERYDGSLVEITWCETGPFAAGESRTITCEPHQPESWQPFDKVTIHY